LVNALGFLNKFFWFQFWCVWFHSTTKHNISKGTFLQQFIFQSFMFLFATFSSSSLEYSIVSISWFKKQFISIESNNPSINGEWSLSTFCFPSLMHIRLSLEWANIRFDFFRKEIILASWLIWSWTLYHYEIKLSKVFL